MEAFLKTGKLGSGPSTSSSTEVGKKSTTSKTSSAPTPWVEKYRPKSVDEVAYQDEVVSVLKKSLEGADLPNLLFYGPPGTGKTSTILAAARDLFGADMFRNRILELNASDERGIQVIREKVKTFAQQSVSGRRPDGRPCPPFKIIILDEADSMTRDAQSALRRTMEKEGRSTKFCLICNYVSRIIEPLTSRCAKFRFKPLARDILSTRLKMIAEKESLIVDSGAIDALIETSEGDLRKAITSLQSCAALKIGLSNEGSISQRDVYEMAGVIPNKFIDNLFDITKKNSFESVKKFVDDLFCEGFSGSQLISQIHDRVISPDMELSDRQKSVIAERLAVNESRLLDGANEYLQILDLCAVIMQQFSKGP